MGNAEAGAWKGALNAEKALIAQGVFERPSSTRQDMLRCLGCIWMRREQKGTPMAFAGEIADCSGASLSGTALLLNTLCSEDLAATGPKEPGKNSRLPYMPHESIEGLAFKDILGAPEACNSATELRTVTQKGIVYETSIPEAQQTTQTLIMALREFREASGITQIDVANATGIPNETVSRIDQFGLADLQNGTNHLRVTSAVYLVAYATAIGADIVIQPRATQEPPAAEPPAV